MFLLLSCRKEASPEAPLPTSLPQSGYYRVSGSINQDEIWRADKKYLLLGTVRVSSGVTLTIEAGTIVFGDKKTRGGLLVEPGGRLFVRGKSSLPVIFTSSQPPGQRAPGDWNGIVLLGKAPVNNPNAVFPEIENSHYGGTYPYDNSGTLEYLRIEFAGGNGLGGLVLAGVGKGTKIRNVQVSRSRYKGFYVSGGTFYGTRWIASHCEQEGIFLTEGHTGKLQFGIVAGESGGVLASNGKSLQNKNDQPITSSVLSNFTFFLVGGGNASAVRIKNNSQVNLFNSAIENFPTGIRIEGDESAQAFYTGAAKCRNNVLARCSQCFSVVSSVNALDLLGKLQGENQQSASQLFSSPMENDFLPVAGSPLLNGADFSEPMLSDLLEVSFIGAMAQDWTQEWANWYPDTTEY